MNPTIWSYSENEAVAAEVASAAAAVAGKASMQPVVVMVSRAKGIGPGGRLVLKGPPADSAPEVLAEAIRRAAEKFRPSAILIGGTRDGREVASRLAAKMKVACLTEGVNVSVEGSTLTADRNVYAGKAVAKVGSPFPAVAMVKVGFYSRSQSSEGEIQEFDVGEIRGTVKVLSRSKKAVSSVDLKSAKVIVSAGRGVKKKEDLAMVESLARSMGGALGCSRPLSSDLGWLPEEHHIGLTGITVKPDLYLAVGISGQLQHIAGMKDSKVVASINTDKDAPIFLASDYGIVGDLYQLVPAIQRALDRRARAGS